MIKGKGSIQRVAGNTFCAEFLKACEKLPDNNDYLFVICDNTKNRNLPFLSYLFSVVLKYLSDALPNKPGTTALYRFFEEKFAPVHSSEINGKQFLYRDLKSERSNDVNEVIEKIVEYAYKTWGIEVPRQDDLKDPALRELHSQAYLNQEVDWSNFISSRNITKDERRTEENERVSGVQ